MKQSTKTGYTLPEVLIYIAILSVLLVAIVQSLLLLTNSYKNIKAVRSIESSAITAIDRMETDIRGAESINTGNSSFNVNPGVLTITTGATTTKFYVSNQRMYVDENGVQVGPLTNADVKVTSLIFRSISTTTSSAVKIEMSLQSSYSSALTKNFYMTTVLRGSYQ